MASTFIYSALPQGAIRLLTFSLSNDNELVCRMNYSPQQGLKGQYYALSYTWGTDPITKTITCNGSSLSITANLYEAIQNLFRPPISLDLPIWIDALCINQTDDVEKSIQVQAMGEIFRNARQVVVWLGASRQDSDIAMDWMERLSEALPVIPHAFAISDAELLRLNLPGIYSPAWHALGHLFRREWFSRLWTFQEIVLAHDVLFVCGHKTTKLLVTVGNSLRRLFLHHFCVQNQSMKDHEDGFWALADIGQTREIMARDSEVHITYLLSIASSRLCSDPRDRVYAMLGLTKQTFRDRMPVSYSNDQGIIQTYIDCARICIEESSSGILELVGAREHDPSVPSWCPNLMSPQETQVFRNDSWDLRAGNSGKDIDSKPFCGRTMPGCYELTLSGFQVDTVVEVVGEIFPNGVRPMQAFANKFIAFESHCLALAQKTTSIGQDTIPWDHIATICAFTTSQATSTEEEEMRTAYLDIMVNSKSVAQGQEHHYPPKERQGVFHELWYCIDVTCVGRRYFSTANGRVGLGPPEIERGDKICVFYGTRPVWALREVEGMTRKWRLLGDAFVHGLMELDKTPQSARGPDEDFVII